MKLISLKQRSSEWLQWRRNRICASDANIIMGTCNFKSIQQLYEEKIKCYEKVPNHWMRRGIELEPIALEAFEKESDLIMFSCVGEHENGWMAASFDGMTIEQDAIVEIKCGGAKGHSMALQGELDPRYYPQIQHQIEVAGLEVAFYYSFDRSQGIILEVKRDQSFIDNMIEKEFEFWQSLQTLTPPLGKPKSKRRNYGSAGIVS